MTSKSTLNEHFTFQLSSRKELIKFSTVDAANKQSSDRLTDLWKGYIIIEKASNFPTKRMKELQQ